MDSITGNSSILNEEGTKPLQNWFTELFQPENLRHSWPWTIFFISIYTIIFVVGFAGNFIVIFVFSRRRQMRSVTNMFIVNLAVADLFVILFCVPVTLMTNIFVHWFLGTFMCKCVAYIQGISVFASAYSLAVISAERCKGIYRFIPVINHLTKFQALLIIAVIWTSALVILVPWPIVFDVTPIPENGTTLFCVENWNNEHTGNMYFLFGNLMCCYAIPGIIICVTNSQACWKVSHRKVSVALGSPMYVTNQHHKVKSGVKKMLSLVTFTFLLSWLPLYLVMYRVKFTAIEAMSETELDILEVLIPICQLLGASNSCINPVFYAYTNARFREMFRSVFYIPTSCRLACLENCQRITNSQRCLLEGECSRNSNCRCRNCIANNTTQESNSTSSFLITLRSHDPAQDFGIPREIGCVELKPQNVTTYFYAKQKIRVSKYCRETSV